MRCARIRGLGIAVFLAAPWGAAVGVARADFSASRPSSAFVVADFENAVPQGTQSGNVEVKIVVDPRLAASGTGCLQVRILNNTEDAYIVFPLPAESTVEPQSKLVAWIRRADTGKPIRMHWLALDADNWVILQRRFQYEGTGEWVRMEWPLSQWRWGNERAGDWADVRAVALSVESEVSELYLDEIALNDHPTTDAFREEFLRRTAFPNRKSRIAVEDGFLAGTDAVEEVSTSDLKDLIAQMKRVREWSRRVFADSAHPMSEVPPTALLAFRQRDDYLAFFQRLGLRWNVEIVPPKGGGYTVQDLSACVYDRGTRSMPVALHESVHAVLSRQLRLLPGAPAHAWLHEALANYLQLCVYPQSLRAGEYTENFSKPIGPRTFFRPLEELLGKPVAPVASKRYAQLASLAAYLVQEKPDWLRQIARGLADGRELADVLKGLDTDLPRLERLWFEWGRRTYVQSPGPAGEATRHFPLPREWTEQAKT